MGCGCGGSGGAPAAPTPGEKPKRGPGSEGYYWSGPSREWNGPKTPGRPESDETATEE